MKGSSHAPCLSNGVPPTGGRACAIGPIGREDCGRSRDHPDRALQLAEAGPDRPGRDPRDNDTGVARAAKGTEAHS